jgi:hypothetical protein
LVDFIYSPTFGGLENPPPVSPSFRKGGEKEKRSFTPLTCPSRFREKFDNERGQYISFYSARFIRKERRGEKK